MWRGEKVRGGWQAIIDGQSRRQPTRFRSFSDAPGLTVETRVLIAVFEAPGTRQSKPRQ